MTIFNKILIVIICILIVIGSYFYIKFTNIKSELKIVENQKMVLVQNEQSLKDQLSYKADSISNLALMVKKLNENSYQKGKEYKVLEVKYKVLIDSLIKINSNTHNYITDSTIIVYFNGQQRKIHYDGRTIFEIRDSSSRYDIKIWQDPYDYKNEIKIDSAGIIRSYVYTDGQLILYTQSIIDSLMFLNMFNPDNIEKKIGFFDRLSVFSDFDVNYNKDASSQINLGIGVLYNFENGFIPYLCKYIGHTNFNFGIIYKQSISNMIKIF